MGLQMNSTIDFYNENAQSFFDNTVNADLSEIYDKFLGNLPDGGSILDAGCGSGRDSKAFIDKGFEVTAFDASEEMARMASDYTGLSVYEMTFQDVDWQDKFDGIWACASLLHVPMNELGLVFDKLLQALKKDGVICCSFKYGDTERTKDGRFFSDLDERRLRQLVGYKANIETWITKDVRPGRDDEKWLDAIIRL